MIFFCFRGLPALPRRGVGYGDRAFGIYTPEIFGLYGSTAIFKISGIPRASAGFRGVHAGESGAEIRSPDSVSTGDISFSDSRRIIPFLDRRGDSAGISWMPEGPTRGVWYGGPRSKLHPCRGYSDSRWAGAYFLSTVGIPACPCRGVRYGDPKFDSSISQSIRNLGALTLFLDAVSFRGLPVGPCKRSGAESRSPNADPPGNIRILGGL